MAEQATKAVGVKVHSFILLSRCVFPPKESTRQRLHVLLVETVDGISLSERVQRPEDPVVTDWVLLAGPGWRVVTLG